MSLWEVKDRSDRVSKWLREDDELIGSLYNSIERALHENPESYSLAEHERNVRVFKDIVTRYATLVERAASTDEAVERAVKKCPKLRNAIRDGYIEISSGD